MLNIILLSGGSGSRLWPLSNDARSKQFLKVLRDDAGRGQSMVQRTFSMLDKVPVEKNIVIATCASQKSSIEIQLADSEYDIVIEPERRDTAPAIMLAASYLAWEKDVSEDDTVVVMPIDTYASQEYYDNLVNLDKAVQSNVAELILQGASPTYPSEKFGYIVPDDAFDGLVRRVERFVEKPSEEQAEALIAKGALWNCGVFAFKLKYLMDILAKYTAIREFETLRDAYTDLPKNSFDYEVVEKADSIGVIKYEGEWKDLGTWNTLTEEMNDFSSGKVLSDDTCHNTHIVNETDLPMVVAGLKDAVVVATPDGILVSDKETSAHIKPLVSQASESRPMYESRQWGEYRVISKEDNEGDPFSLEKILIVKPGKQLSYQKHFSRSEVWTITSGFGEVVLDDVVKPVSYGSVIFIEPGVKHAVRAAVEDLHIVEVQLGANLVEEDIERFGFFWNDEGEE